ncbi:hypothetical protein GCM10028820_31680 [Tessaracoccus terricola]
MEPDEVVEYPGTDPTVVEPSVFTSEGADDIGEDVGPATVAAGLRRVADVAPVAAVRSGPRAILGQRVLLPQVTR